MLTRYYDAPSANAANPASRHRHLSRRSDARRRRAEIYFRHHITGRDAIDVTAISEHIDETGNGRAMSDTEKLIIAACR